MFKKAFVILLPFLIYSPYLFHHLSIALSGAFTDDARAQIFPFYSVSYGDFIADYYRSAFSPPAWRLMFEAASYLFDPLQFGNVLGYILWGATLVFLSLSALELGGLPAAFGVLLFAIPSPIFFDRMMGGLPRAFAYPFLSLGIYFFLTKRFRWLFWTVPVSALFYPVSAVFLFILYSLFQLREIRKIIFLTFLLGVSFVPQYIDGMPYGRRLNYADAAIYPEVGPQGRFGGAENPPFQSFLQGARTYSKIILMPREDPHLKGSGSFRKWKEWLLLAVLSVAVVYAAVKIRELFYVSIAAFIAYQLSVFIAPYLFHPQRYLVFSIPLLSVLFLCCVTCRILNRSFMAACALMIALNFFWGGVGKDSVGFMSIKAGTNDFYQAVSRLPDSSYIAGWPEGVLNSIPVLSHKRIFLSYETHQVFHEKYVQEMRDRMNLLIDTYFGSDAAKLEELKRRYNVSHFIIDRRYFRPEKEDKKNRLEYFEPFTQKIRERLPMVKESYLYKITDDRCIILYGPLCVIEL